MCIRDSFLYLLFKDWNSTTSTSKQTFYPPINQMRPNGINIELTPKQYDYLYETLMEAYSNDVAEQKDWDVQTFDNLIDNVCNGKSTYLSSDVKGVLH